MDDVIIIKTIQEWGGSYDEIHEVLYRAHQANRDRGIVYKSALLDGNGIRNRVGNGMTLVAIKDDIVIGTASVSLRTGKYWFDRGLLVAHYCLAGVLPEFQGQGIMKKLDEIRDSFAISYGAKIIRSGTAEKNIIQRKKFKKTGFIPVDFLVTKGNGYYSVMYAKWIDTSIAPSKFFCRLHHFKSKIRTRLFYKPDGSKRMVGKVLGTHLK